MTRERYKKKMQEILRAGLLAGFICGAVLLGVIALIGFSVKARSDKQQKQALQQENAELKEELESANTLTGSADDGENKQQLSADEGWNLALVNKNYPLDTTYVPELVEFEEDFQIDKRIEDAATAMFEQAKKDGLSLTLVSAYRSYDEQVSVFNETMETWISQGKTPYEAYTETSKSIALPGCSEHATGLALDIVSASYTELDEQQAETDEAKWLKENCAEYGFILRYPVDKMEITNITYEPWHYRYVGTEAATEIMEQGITLEEYLAKQQ